MPSKLNIHTKSYPVRSTRAQNISYNERPFRKRADRNKFVIIRKSKPTQPLSLFISNKLRNILENETEMIPNFKYIGPRLSNGLISLKILNKETRFRINQIIKDKFPQLVVMRDCFKPRFVLSFTVSNISDIKMKNDSILINLRKDNPELEDVSRMRKIVRKGKTASGVEFNITTTHTGFSYIKKQKNKLNFRGKVIKMTSIKKIGYHGF